MLYIYICIWSSCRTQSRIPIYGCHWLLRGSHSHSKRLRLHLLIWRHARAIWTPTKIFYFYYLLTNVSSAASWIRMKKHRKKCSAPSYVIVNEIVRRLDDEIRENAISQNAPQLSFGAINVFHIFRREKENFCWRLLWYEIQATHSITSLQIGTCFSWIRNIEHIALIEGPHSTHSARTWIDFILDGFVDTAVAH